MRTEAAIQDDSCDLNSGAAQESHHFGECFAVNHTTIVDKVGDRGAGTGVKRPDKTDDIGVGMRFCISSFAKIAFTYVAVII